MKIINKTTALILVQAMAMAFVLSLSSCHKHKVEPNVENQFLKELSSGAWEMSTATVSQVNVNDQFPGLILTINTDGSYSVTNPVPAIWPASGTITAAKTGSDYTLTRNDGMVMHVDNETATTLALSFQYTAPTSRIAGVSGQYSFVFTRK